MPTAGRTTRSALGSLHQSLSGVTCCPPARPAPLLLVTQASWPQRRQPAQEAEGTGGRWWRTTRAMAAAEPGVPRRQLLSTAVEAAAGRRSRLPRTASRRPRWWWRLPPTAVVAGWRRGRTTCTATDEPCTPLRRKPCSAGEGQAVAGRRIRSPGAAAERPRRRRPPPAAEVAGGRRWISPRAPQGAHPHGGNEGRGEGALSGLVEVNRLREAAAGRRPAPAPAVAVAVGAGALGFGWPRHGLQEQPQR